MEFNLAQVFEAVAARIPDREAIVWGDRRITYSQLDERANRLANHLLTRGLGIHTERHDLENWMSGQDHLALCLHNSNEFIEGMLGAFKARIAPFNVNHRYVDEELVYLLRDANAASLVFHSTFAPTLTKVIAAVPSLKVLLQVDDGSGHGLVSGAEWFEEALAGASDDRPDTEPGPDDLYLLYTGGTTGMPKGVMWRQADIFTAAMGGRDIASAEEWSDISEIVDNAEVREVRLMPCAPFMHGAAHWMALTALNWGNTVVIRSNPHLFDPVDVWRTVETMDVNIMLIVGDAFGRPLLEELERNDYDTSSMIMLVSGGATLSEPVKQGFLAMIPEMAILDGLGASETGQQANQILGTGARATTGIFRPGPGMAIVDENRESVLGLSDDRIGWLAQTGRIPLGYLGDRERSERTFPLIDGIRHAVPGDRASYTTDGLVHLRGRDSTTINSGGEKVFAEEVERVLANHPGVYDVVVTGRESERWGAEVVAIVQRREGSCVTADSLIAEAGRHLARYKLPKDIVFVDRLVRSATGKADYRWARDMVSRPIGTRPSLT